MRYDADISGTCASKRSTEMLLETFLSSARCSCAVDLFVYCRRPPVHDTENSVLDIRESRSIAMPLVYPMLQSKPGKGLQAIIKIKVNLVGFKGRVDM